MFTKIRVLIADDHAVLREPLRAWLEEEADFEVVGEASDGAEAIRLTRQLRPDILLLDLSMPKMDGLQVARELHHAQPDVRIVVLTASSGTIDMGLLMGLGIRGYTSKTTRLGHLVGILQLVHIGHACFPVEVELHPRECSGGPSTRELEVLRLVAEGHRNRDIATSLCISEPTVQFHLHKLSGRLHARSRTEVVHLARQKGWIP